MFRDQNICISCGGDCEEADATYLLGIAPALDFRPSAAIPLVQRGVGGIARYDGKRKLDIEGLFRYRRIVDQRIFEIRNALIVIQIRYRVRKARYSARRLISRHCCAPLS